LSEPTTYRVLRELVAGRAVRMRREPGGHNRWGKVFYRLAEVSA
jgi:hypothetical protein